MNRFIKTLSTAVLLCATIITASAQTGPWSGKLEAYGSSITLVFHLNEDACKMDSPDQGAYDIPATLTRNGLQISITVPTIGATYEGLLVGEKIAGTYTQLGQTFPLTLTPGTPKLNDTVSKSVSEIG